MTVADTGLPGRPSTNTTRPWCTNDANVVGLPGFINTCAGNIYRTCYRVNTCAGDIYRTCYRVNTCARNIYRTCYRVLTSDLPDELWLTKTTAATILRNTTLHYSTVHYATLRNANLSEVYGGPKVSLQYGAEYVLIAHADTTSRHQHVHTCGAWRVAL